MDKDTCVIASYQPSSGIVTCQEKLKGFHYGDSESTVGEYGVDLRAEVALLSRDIEVRASTDDLGPILRKPWGCRVLVSDFFEPDLTYRTGSLEMDSVSVYNCSQLFTHKAAIKF